MVRDGPSATARAFRVPKTSLLRHRDNCLKRPAAEAGTPAAPPVASAPPPEESIDEAPAVEHERVGRAPGHPCASCRSPVREVIEARLLAGDPWATIAREVPAAPCLSSIRHHAQKCIPDLIRRATGEREQERGRVLLERLEQLVSRTEAQMSEADALLRDARETRSGGEDDDAPDPFTARTMAIRAAADASRTMKAVLDLYGKLTGFGAAKRGDIRDAKQWGAFTRGIARATADCDGCSHAVEEALASLEDDAA